MFPRYIDPATICQAVLKSFSLTRIRASCAFAAAEPRRRKGEINVQPVLAGQSCKTQPPTQAATEPELHERASYREERTNAHDTEVLEERKLEPELRFL